MTYKDYAEEIEAFAKAEDPRAHEGTSGSKNVIEPVPDGQVKIGRVVSVEGSRVIALLEPQELLDHPDPADVLQIGALVKIRTPETMVFGMVCGLSIPIPSQSEGDREMHIVELELVGEAMDSSANGPLEFRRGVSFCPALGEAVYPATQEDLRQVYAKPDVESAKVGTIYQDQRLPAFVAIDDLLGKHFAVLGTTGSGKSCAVATILRAILQQHRDGHILLLDLHNEYSQAFQDCAEVLGPSTLALPYWLMNFEELQETLIDDREDREADLTILKDAVVYARQAYQGSEDDTPYCGADTPVPYRMSDVLQRVDESLGRLDRPTDAAPYLRLRERINSFQSDRRFDFMFQEELTIKDTMVDVLSQLFRIPANGKPITILNLSEVPSDIMNVVISLVCRMTFDFALWAERSVPMLLVCEEAHRYAGQTSGPSFEPTRRTLSKIAREGRKYGVSIGLVSQRPSELPVGILSQCNTIFALRMSNQKDQEFVRGTMSESGLGLISTLPSLRTGETIAVGEGVPVPMRFCFDFLPEEIRPHSGTACFSGAWKEGDKDKGFVAEIVARWRNQHR